MPNKQKPTYSIFRRTTLKQNQEKIFNQHGPINVYGSRAFLPISADEDVLEIPENKSS